MTAQKKDQRVKEMVQEIWTICDSGRTVCLKLIEDCDPDNVPWIVKGIEVFKGQHTQRVSGFKARPKKLQQKRRMSRQNRTKLI